MSENNVDPFLSGNSSGGMVYSSQGGGGVDLLNASFATVDGQEIDSGNEEVNGVDDDNDDDNDEDGGLNGNEQTGRWTKAEHALFVEALNLYGKVRVAQFIA